MDAFFKNKRRSLRAKIGAGSLRFTGTPPLSRPYVGSSGSHQSTCSGSSWVLWRDSGMSSHHSSGHLCTIVLGISVFLVVIAVLSIAALAVYMGYLRIDTSKVNLVFDGGLRVALGDEFTPDLSDNSSTAFRQKAIKYQSIISNIYERSILNSAIKECTVLKFENGSLLVFFRLILDRRKVPSLENIEDSAKEILLDELIHPKLHFFQNISIDKQSVFIRRHTDNNLQSYSHNLDHSTMIRDNRTLEIRNGVILKSSTTNINKQGVGSVSQTKSENNTNKDMVTTQSALSDISDKNINFHILDDSKPSSIPKNYIPSPYISNTNNSGKMNLANDDIDPDKEIETFSIKTAFSEKKDVNAYDPLTTSTDYYEIDKLKNTLLEKGSSELVQQSARYDEQSPSVVQSIVDDIKAVVPSEIIKNITDSINEEKNYDNFNKKIGEASLHHDSATSYYEIISPVSVIEELSKIGTKVLLPKEEIFTGNNPVALSNMTYNSRYDRYSTVKSLLDDSNLESSFIHNEQPQQHTVEHVGTSFSEKQPTYYNSQSDAEPWKPIIAIPTEEDGLKMTTSGIDGIAEILVIPPSTVDISENETFYITNNDNMNLKTIAPQNTSHLSGSSTLHDHMPNKGDKVMESTYTHVNKEDSEVKEIMHKQEQINSFYTETFSLPNKGVMPSDSTIMSEKTKELDQNFHTKKSDIYLPLSDFSILEQFENVKMLLNIRNDTNVNPKFTAQSQNEHYNLNETYFQDPIKILTHIASSIHKGHEHNKDTSFTALTSTESMLSSQYTPPNLEKLDTDTYIEIYPSEAGTHSNSNIHFQTTEHMPHEQEIKNKFTTFPPVSSLEIVEINDDDELMDNETYISSKSPLANATPLSNIVTLLPVKSNSGILRPLRPRPPLKIPQPTTVTTNSNDTVKLLKNDNNDNNISSTFSPTKENVDVPNIYSIFQVGNSKQTINNVASKILDNKNQSKSFLSSITPFSGSFNLTTASEDIALLIKTQSSVTKQPEKLLNETAHVDKNVGVSNPNENRLGVTERDSNDEYNNGSKTQTKILHTKAILELITRLEQIKHIQSTTSPRAPDFDNTTRKEISNVTLLQNLTTGMKSNNGPDNSNVTTIYIDVNPSSLPYETENSSLIPILNVTNYNHTEGIRKKTERESLSTPVYTKLNISLDDTPTISTFIEEPMYIKLPQMTERESDIYNNYDQMVKISDNKSYSHINIAPDFALKINNSNFENEKNGLFTDSIRQPKSVNKENSSGFEISQEFLEDEKANDVTNDKHIGKLENLVNLYVKVKHLNKKREDYDFLSYTNAGSYKNSTEKDISGVTENVKFITVKPINTSTSDGTVISDHSSHYKTAENSSILKSDRNDYFPAKNEVLAKTNNSIPINLDPKILEKIETSDKMVTHTNFSVSKISVIMNNQNQHSTERNINKNSNTSVLMLSIPANFSLENDSGIYQINQSTNKAIYPYNHIAISEQAMNALSKFAVIHTSSSVKSDVYFNNSHIYVKDSEKEKDELSYNIHNTSKDTSMKSNMTKSTQENSSYPSFTMMTKIYHRISTTENYSDTKRNVFPEDDTSVEIISQAPECPSNFSLRCGDGECISEMSRCNQLVDCNDGADERGCTCADYMRAQFLTRKLCDGIVDCWDFTDENDCDWCSPGQFVCPNSQVCIDQEKLCNGQRDCPYGDDEKQCFTVSNSRALAGEFSYHKEGFLMVRKEGKWGKLCIENFDIVVNESQTSWKISDLGRAVCKAMTYSDFDQVNRMIDHVANRQVDEEEYYELGYTSSESNKASPRSSLSFRGTPCIKKEVIHVACRDLECGIRPKAVSDLGRLRHSRIVGGANALPGSWPWLAAVYKEGEFQCGATLISERWLISAGHCFFHALDDFWIARLGTLRRGTNFPSPYEQLRSISNIILHPAYIDNGFINDISLLRMEEPVFFSDYVRPICLPSPNQQIREGKICTVVGWGKLFETGSIFPDTLQEVQLPLISSAECRKKTLFIPLYRITENMICAGYERGGRDACLGDSGGPLMCQAKDGKYSLYAITSNGYGCARANRPGVYTKVANYVEWIETTIQQEFTMMRSIKNYCKGHRCPLGECLPQNRICNGFMECSDGSDERGCW